MITFLKKNLTVGAFFAAALAALYAFVPPPQQARAQLSAPATYITTVGGTANAITATIPNISALADIKGVPITIVPGSANTGPTTINFNGFGAVNVFRITGNALGGGELANVVTLLYNGTSFYITSSQDLTPPGTAIDIRGTVAPTGYLIEDGSCVSQTTYAALFTAISTGYGSCSAGLFALPDSRGTVFAARDNQGVNGAAGRINTAGSNCNAVSNIFCGLQNASLTIANIASFTPTGTVSTTGTVPTPTGPAGSAGGVVASTSNGVSNTLTSTIAATSTFTGNALGSNTPHPVLNPVLIGLRAVKY